MLQLARAIDWTVVTSDTEALILEHTWIQEFEPPFNVQFRDDKSYPYLAVTLADEAPRLLITRNSRIKGARYYGPYPKVWALKQLTAHLQQAFPIRTCNDSDYRRAMQSQKPCLSGQIGRCHGPCSHLITVEEHREQVQRLVAFLNGGDSDLTKQLTAEMQAAAAELDYERAARLRDQIIGIEHVLEQNAIVLRAGETLDVFGMKSDDLYVAIHQFMVQNGRVRGERSWIVESQLDHDDEVVLQHALQSAYDDGPAPARILVPLKPADEDALVQALSRERPRGGRVRITVPERGEKLRLLDRANLNAGEQLLRHKLKRAADITSRTDALAELQQALGTTEPPLRIECIDVSHLQGSEVVASLVVFEDALPAKSEYRKYRIEETTDDTDSIYQVVQRRAAQLVKILRDEDTLTGVRARRLVPDLIIVDGGQPQVNAAARALKDSELHDLAAKGIPLPEIVLCGIAKRLEEIWLPEDPFPLILPRSSEALFLVQRIRDEAHRFAITFQRQRRSRGIKSLLAEIPGLGPKRTTQLLRHFGSVARLKQATVDELSSIPGFGVALAETIERRLRQAEPGTLEDGDTSDNSERTSADHE